MNTRPKFLNAKSLKIWNKYGAFDLAKYVKDGKIKINTDLKIIQQEFCNEDNEKYIYHGQINDDNQL